MFPNYIMSVFFGSDLGIIFGVKTSSLRLHTLSLDSYFVYLFLGAIQLNVIPLLFFFLAVHIY